MLCCKCKKNQATNVYERIVDGKKQPEYYCSECFRRLFISADVFPEGEENTCCPYCGMTAKEFKLRKMVGCERCYQTLFSDVIPVVIAMQGREIHAGKRPKKNNKQISLFEEALR